MEQEKIDLKRKELLSKFGHASEVLSYIEFTLNNFCHRYMDTSTQSNIKTQIDGDLFYAESIEGNILEALKISYRPVKDKVIALAKKYPTQKENQRVKFILEVNVVDLQSNSGELKISSVVQCDYPKYQNMDLEIRKTIQYTYDDILDFRKELALKLEEVCEIII